MPKITITEPFNFASGGNVTHYKKGPDQDVPQAVAEHAMNRGFTPKPKPKAEAPAATAEADK
ncbi:glycogen branching protein [Pseudomonas sp.]|uniref:hypothetical protein n=1 Tax=Pseudomonas sp. TaxID=306 RepID=UPI002731C6FD|nr:glycogen branching protein [Pseudomonas sp.]MDP2444162.1 glycogen branching protein [Pseudomonas sp.]MDZ4337118.1 glycogen branching protein [Pseudomonas sp.]